MEEHCLISKGISRMSHTPVNVNQATDRKFVISFSRRTRNRSLTTMKMSLSSCKMDPMPSGLKTRWVSRQTTSQSISFCHFGNFSYDCRLGFHVFQYHFIHLFSHVLLLFYIIIFHMFYYYSRHSFFICFTIILCIYLLHLFSYYFILLFFIYFIIILCIYFSYVLLIFYAFIFTFSFMHLFSHVLLLSFTIFFKCAILFYTFIFICFYNLLESSSTN